MTAQKNEQFRCGDEQAGYHLVCLPLSHRLSVEMWGVWKEKALVEGFKKDVLNCMMKLKVEGEWDVFGDLIRFPIQPEVIFDLISNLMLEAKRRRVRRVAVVHDSPMIRLAIGRLAKGVGLDNMEFFSPERFKGESEESAVSRVKVTAEKWLLKNVQ